MRVYVYVYTCVYSCFSFQHLEKNIYDSTVSRLLRKIYNIYYIIPTYIYIIYNKSFLSPFILLSSLSLSASPTA